MVRHREKPSIFSPVVVRKSFPHFPKPPRKKRTEKNGDEDDDDDDEEEEEEEEPDGNLTPH